MASNMAAAAALVPAGAEGRRAGGRPPRLDAARGERAPPGGLARAAVQLDQKYAYVYGCIVL